MTEETRKKLFRLQEQRSSKFWPRNAVDCWQAGDSTRKTHHAQSIWLGRSETNLEHIVERRAALKERAEFGGCSCRRCSWDLAPRAPQRGEQEEARLHHSSRQPSETKQTSRAGAPPIQQSSSPGNHGTSSGVGVAVQIKAVGSSMPPQGSMEAQAVTTRAESASGNDI